jgi:hypothetical protein
VSSQAEDPNGVMADLAEAAAHQLRRPGLPSSVQLLSASCSDRIAAGVGDVPYIFMLAALMSCSGAVFLISFNPRAVDWALAAGFSLSLSLFSLIEPTCGRPPGKRTLDLRLVRETDAPRGAVWLRWVLKHAPTLALTTVCFAAVVGFPPPGVDADPMVLIGLGVQLAYWFAALWAYARTGRAPVYDRLSGIRVVRARWVSPRPQDVPGFEVLPVLPRPVLPVGLEASPPGGYPPSAGHE